MAEQNFPVEILGVDYICDDCGRGQMRPEEPAMSLDPPGYRHACNACGVSRILANLYPTTGWRRAAPEKASA